MASTTKHQLVSVTEAAVVVAVSTRTARRHVADGHLAAVQLGRKTLRSRSNRAVRRRHTGRWVASGSRVIGQRTMHRRCKRQGRAPDPAYPQVRGPS